MKGRGGSVRTGESPLHYMGRNGLDHGSSDGFLSARSKCIVSARFLEGQTMEIETHVVARERTVLLELSVTCNGGRSSISNAACRPC